MRIAMFTTDFPLARGDERATRDPNWWGGVGVVAARLTSELARRGHTVEVFTTFRGGSLEVEYGGGSVRAFRPDLVVGDSNVSFKLMLIRSSQKPDLVHVHRGSPPGALAGFLYARRHRIPLITSYHGGLFFRGRKLNEWLILQAYRFAEHWMLRKSAAIIALTPSARQIAELKPFLQKVRIVPNGVDMPEGALPSQDEARERLAIPRTQTVCLYAGALNYRKGFDLVLEVGERLRKSVNPMVVAIGHVPRGAEPKRTAASSGGGKSIRFDGFVNEEMKPYYFRAADMLLLPSRLEGFPLTLLEALAYGLPVIASDIPPLAEIVGPAGAGLVFRSGDAEDLCDKIRLLAKDRSLQANLRDKGLRLAAEFTWDKVVDRMIAVYETATGTRS